MLVLLSPFFLLFCATSGSAAYLAHRLFILEVKPALAEKLTAMLTAFMSVALSTLAYCIRLGAYQPARITPETSAIVAALTGIGVAFVCLKCVWEPEESSGR